jgi:hypothetical protein
MEAICSCRFTFSGLHDIISQKTASFNAAAVKTSTALFFLSDIALDMKKLSSSDRWKLVFMDVPALVTSYRNESFLLKFCVILKEPEKKLQHQGNINS